MALRAAPKTRTKDLDPAGDAPLVVDQRKKADERFRLQVDRQTKRSFTTLKSAVEAGLLIKQAHPIVQVSVYDSVDCINQLVDVDGAVPAEPDAEPA
jgi:hypothetical protein